MGNWDKVKGNLILYQGTWIARNHVNLLSRYLDFKIWIRKKKTWGFEGSVSQPIQFDKYFVDTHNVKVNISQVLSLSNSKSNRNVHEQWMIYIKVHLWCGLFSPLSGFCGSICYFWKYHIIYFYRIYTLNLF